MTLDMTVQEIKDSDNEATVHRYRYVRYEGNYTSQINRIFSFVRFEIKNILLGSKAVRRSLYASIFFWAIISLFNTLFLSIYWEIVEEGGFESANYFLQIFGLELDIHSMLLESFFGYFASIPNAIPFWLFISSVCAQAFYPDYANRTVEDYFTRISRKEYLISKFLSTYSFILFPFIILISISYFWFSSSLRIPALDLDNLVILIFFIFWIALLLLILTLFGLFLSTNSKQNTVIILFFVTMLFITNFSWILVYGSSDIFHLLNVVVSSRTLLIFFSGGNITDYTIPILREPDLALQLTIITITGIILFLSFYITQKILRREP